MGTDTTTDTLTVPEAAAALGLSRSAVYGLVAAGRLGCYRHGPRRIRVGRGHLADYLASVEVPARDHLRDASNMTVRRPAVPDYVPTRKVNAG